MTGSRIITMTMYIAMNVGESSGTISEDFWCARTVGYSIQIVQLSKKRRCFHSELEISLRTKEKDGRGLRRTDMANSNRMETLARSIGSVTSCIAIASQISHWKDTISGLKLLDGDRRDGRPRRGRRRGGDRRRTTSKPSIGS